jgi:hypothetical protein
MASFLDVCRFTAVSSGTGSFVVSAAVTGYQTPASANAVDGATYRYRAESSDLSQWEVGYGVYTSGTVTLTRATVLFNSSGGASAINFSAAPQVAVVLLAEDVSPIDGYIYGLTLSNNGTDATNDIDIAAGAASDSTANAVMRLSAAITKRLDAAWAVGTNAGGLDTGSIANASYHVWLIQRSDTGVVDALFSTSATAPTMPTNYDRKRRIGSIIRASAAILAFTQKGDLFQRDDASGDRSSTTAHAKALLAVGVPSGIRVQPLIQTYTAQNAAGSSSAAISDGNSSTYPDIGMGEIHAASEASYNYLPGGIYTNTSAQIYYTLTITSGSLSFGVVNTLGWIDTRGRDGW